MEGTQGGPSRESTAATTLTQRRGLKPAEKASPNAQSFQNHGGSDETPLHPSSRVADRICLTEHLMSVLADEFIILEDLQTNFWPTFWKILALACLLWMAYALTLCGSNQDICDRAWLYSMPIRALSTHGLRKIFFEFCWCYTSTAYLVRAGFFGISKTFREAHLATQLTTTPKTSNWLKNKSYILYFLDTGIENILQPLLFYFVSRTVGQSSISVLQYAEGAVYTGLALQLARILFDVLERVVFDRGWHHLRLTVFIVLGVLLGAANFKSYVHSYTFQSSWAAAQQFKLLGDAAEDVVRRV